MSDLDAALAKINSIENALGQPDEAKIYGSLANYENKLQYTMSQLYEQLGEDSTDAEKREYYRAQNEYNYVSETLGSESPAKVIA